MPPERGEIFPGALLSAVVKKDEALLAQVQSWAIRSSRGVGSLSPSEWQLRGDMAAFFKYSSG